MYNSFCKTLRRERSLARFVLSLKKSIGWIWNHLVFETDVNTYLKVSRFIKWVKLILLYADLKWHRPGRNSELRVTCCHMELTFGHDQFQIGWLEFRSVLSFNKVFICDFPLGFGKNQIQAKFCIGRQKAAADDCEILCKAPKPRSLDCSGNRYHLTYAPLITDSNSHSTVNLKSINVIQQFEL